MSKFGKKTIQKLVAVGALAVMLIVLLILSNNQKVCEFFATTIARGWIAVFGTLFGWLPFSMFELFLVLAILGAIAFVVFVIIFLSKRRWQKLISLTLAVVISVLAFVNVYTMTASFTYNRNPLPTSVYTEHSSNDFSYEEAVAMAQLLVEKANYAYENTDHDENGNIVYPFSFSELSDMLAEEYKRLDDSYFSPFTPKGKRIANKWIMSQLHITGVFFAPFGEANVNGNENSLYLPHTLAHEMAHGKGVMREYQADLVAYYVLLTSENPYLQYGALAKMANVALGMVRLYPNSNETYQTLYASLNKGIAQEKYNYSEFYAQFTLLEDVGNFFNDIYLKLQKQEEGVNSYVKPGEIQGTGQTDDQGQEILRIINFSGTQNLLITMFKQNLLQPFSD